MGGFDELALIHIYRQLGEEMTKDILSEFSCPLSPDVEVFLKAKALEYLKAGWSSPI